MIGYISIILGFLVLLYMLTKGWSAIIVGVASALVVAIFNGLQLTEIFTETYFPAFGNVFGSLFPPIFSGFLFSKVYTRSGAVVTIGDSLSNMFFKKASSDTKKYISAILTIVIVSGTISYCGMNSLVTLIAMYPVALRVMERAGIPKRFVMGILSGGVYTFALCAPGTTETLNILAMQALGTKSYAGLIAGSISVVVELVIMTAALVAMIKKSVAKGETFCYGQKDKRAENDPSSRPKLLVALMPFILLLVLFNLLSVNIFFATMISCLLGVILFWNHIEGLDEVKNMITEAGKSCLVSLGTMGSIVGFAAVVQTLPQFQVIMDGIFSMRVPAVVMLVVAVALVAGLTGSCTSAMRISIPLILERCQAAGLSLETIHRVSAFAATTIDTLPWSSAVIINLGIADIDMKEGYPPMFASTTLATIFGTITCSVIMYLFPALP